MNDFYFLKKKKKSDSDEPPLPPLPPPEDLFEKKISAKFGVSNYVSHNKFIFFNFYIRYIMVNIVKEIDLF